MIFNQPFSKLKHFTEKGMYAENTARDYLNRLSQMGVLEKRSIQGHFYYFNIELGNILGD
jgi:Fic family protein